MFCIIHTISLNLGSCMQIKNEDTIILPHKESLFSCPRYNCKEINYIIIIIDSTHTLFHMHSYL